MFIDVGDVGDVEDVEDIQGVPPKKWNLLLVLQVVNPTFFGQVVGDIGDVGDVKYVDVGDDSQISLTD